MKKKKSLLETLQGQTTSSSLRKTKFNKKSSAPKKEKLQVTKKEYSRARVLLRLYLYIKYITTGVKIPFDYMLNHKSFNIFKSLSILISKYESDTGILINPQLFIKAHFKIFGGNMYPNMLVTAKMWEIYRTYRDNQKIEVKKPTTDESALLKYLSGQRGESEEETLNLFKDAGLFSESFLSGRGCGDIKGKI